jgi:hypothetical protein
MQRTSLETKFGQTDGRKDGQRQNYIPLPIPSVGDKNQQKAIILLSLVAAKIPSFTAIYTLRFIIHESLSKICHPVY